MKLKLDENLPASVGAHGGRDAEAVDNAQVDGACVDAKKKTTGATSREGRRLDNHGGLSREASAGPR